MAVKFGPAGNSDSFSAVHKSSLAAPEWIRAFGLDAYEYQCGKGVNVGEETARKLGENATACGVTMSLHAPYFINLANPDPESLQKTAGYIVSACTAAHWMGAERVVVHTGALMKRTRREALDIAIRSTREVIRIVEGEGYGHITLCLETMGKINQLGDLDEVLELCNLDGRLLPCVDFGHLYARTLGELDGSLEKIVPILDRMEEELGGEAVLGGDLLQAAACGGQVSRLLLQPFLGFGQGLLGDGDSFASLREPQLIVFDLLERGDWQRLDL